MTPSTHKDPSSDPSRFLQGDAFREALRDAVERARNGVPHALLVVRVERLAEAQSACGHGVDAALDQLVHAALTQQVGPGAPLCRLSVDHFALLERRCPPADALILARRLRGALEGGLFRWKDLSFRLGALVSAVELGAPDIAGPEDALEQAVEACAANDRLGNDGVLLLDGTPEKRLQVNREVAWRDHLREVI